MANIRAIANGNWSNNAIWSPAPPTTADDVFASGFTVFVDQNINVLSINTIGAAGIGGGGTFRPNNGVLMTTNVVAGSTTCVTFGSASPNAFSLVGSITGGNTSAAYGINNNSTGNITITGNIVGGSVNSNTHGIYNNSSGTITIFGNVSGSPFATGGTGIYSPNLNGIINIIGNVQGGLGNAGATGNVQTTFFNVTGNVFGGSGSNIHGIQCPYASIITLSGDVYGGTGSSAAGFWLNNASGYAPMTAVVFGNVFGGTGTNAPGIGMGANSNLGFNVVYITGNIRARSGNGLGCTGVAFITGDIFGSDTSSSGNGGAVFSSSASGTIVGSAYGGSQSGAAAVGASSGVITITGNVSAGSGSNSYGIVTQATLGKVFINGSCYGGSGASSFGYYLAGVANTGFVTGSAFAGPGATACGIYMDGGTPQLILSGSAVGRGPGSNSIGVFTNVTNSVAIISGAAIAGNFSGSAYGAQNGNTGIMRVKRAVGNDWGLGYTQAVAGVPGVVGSKTGSTFVEELECGPRGQWPTAGNVYFTPNSKATSMFETDTFQNVTLIESNSADNLLPPVSSVRQGTTYNLGLSTGTCVIPLISSVAVNTLVDNLTGTAVLTPQTTWNYPVTASDINSMGGRLRNALNIDSAEKIINSFSS